jgi:hypothetical protein
MALVMLSCGTRVRPFPTTKPTLAISIGLQRALWFVPGARCFFMRGTPAWRSWRSTLTEQGSWRSWRSTAKKNAAQGAPKAASFPRVPHQGATPSLSKPAPERHPHPPRSPPGCAPRQPASILSYETCDHSAPAAYRGPFSSCTQGQRNRTKMQSQQSNTRPTSRRRARPAVQ